MNGGARAIDPDVVRQAADWFVQLQGADDPRAEAACLAWRRQRPEHELAWQRMADLQRRLQGAAGPDGAAAADAIREGMSRTASRRRAMRWALSVSGLGLVAWQARDAVPWRSWTAQYQTATGERREFALQDGTRVLMNTGTALDVDYTGSARRLLLRRGEILVTSGTDPLRPLQVETRTGRVTPIGTRFTVRNLDDAPDRTAVVVLEGAVALQPALRPQAVVRVAAGQQAGFGPGEASPPRPADATAGAWIDGILAARAMRLDDFLAELGRYRSGVLRCTPEAAGLRITGAFPLQDTDQVLHSLEQILPVSVQYRTRYWVTVAAAPGKL